MNLVIMAGGVGGRMRPMSDTTPKPLLKIAGKTIIEHNIENIISEFDALYIIVKYRKELFPRIFGDTYAGKPVYYIEQGEANGTGAAILTLKGHIQGDFIVVSGDDLYESSDILRLAKHTGYGTLCKCVENPSQFGIIVTNAAGEATDIIEKPTSPECGNFANIGIHKFDDKIFNDLEKIPPSSRGEIEITDLIQQYIQQKKYHIVRATGRWIPLGYPWNILDVLDEIIGKYENNMNKGAVIEKEVSINGNIYLEEGAVIKSGTYIEGNAYIGKGAIIGPNAYIRGNSHIGEQSKIGAFVECKGSYVGDKTSIAHLSYIGDSVIGNHVNIGGGTKIANLRHDNKNIHVMNNEKLIDSSRRKFGSIIADGAHLGINTLIYPGRIINTGASTLPGEIIKKTHG